ncbi:MAG: ATP-binding protein, partial [Phascolarctobacterium sp.]|nr:ATP-binding protein [Phascolarctobacterium sp.]
LRRGYEVYVGVLYQKEIDFVAIKRNEKIYIQVTESMLSEDVRKRELAPLQKIRDNYEKIILSLDNLFDYSYDGIKSLRLLDWLLE